MWQSWFHLQTRPFNCSAAAGLAFPAELRSLQLQQLEETLREREGFALLLGTAGLGKTFLLHRLAERVNESCQLAWLNNARLANIAALHQALLFDWDLPYAGRTEQELRLAVIEQVLHQARHGRPTVAIVDDAHHLTAEQLEELRLLANLESGGGKYFVAVLAGQPTLADNLASDGLASLSQLAGTRVALEPLGMEEAMEFVRQQLRAAGGEAQSLIDDEALELLAQASQGVPRLLLQAARSAFRQAAAAQSRIVDVEAVLAAAEELCLNVDDGAEAELPALSLPRTLQKRSA